MPSNSTDLKDLNATNLKVGTVPAASLGTGPTSTATYLCGNSVWTPSAPPAAGADTQVQYNSSGIIGGSSNFTFNYTTNTLTVPNLIGAGSGITNLNASNIASGTVALARLGSGSPAISTFLRGDGSWQTPPATPPVGPNTSVQINNSGVFGGNLNFTFNSAATPPTVAYNGCLDVTGVSGNVPSLRYWDTSPAVKGGFTIYGTPFGTLAVPCACGRLTFDSAHPAPNGSYSGASAATIYYLPMNGNQITLWNSNLNDFENIRIPDSGLSIPLASAGVSANLMYDVYIYNTLTGGAQITLGAAWTNDNLRSQALSAPVNGMIFWSGNQNYRYVGTIRSQAAGQSADTPALRLLWNAYNQVPRKIFYTYPGNNWTYSVPNNSTSYIRAVNGDQTARVYFVLGLLQNMGMAGVPWFSVDSAQLYYNPPSMATLAGVALNQATVTSWNNEIQSQCNTVNQAMIWNRFIPGANVQLGLNWLTLAEGANNGSAATGGPTFYGQSAWCSMIGFIWC